MSTKKEPACPPPYVYEGHDWKLHGELWICARCNASVGIQKVN